MMAAFKIVGNYVTLGQFLKEISEVPSGGAAKWYLQDYPVVIDGQIENRRGRKLYPGMTVQLTTTDELYTFISDDDNES